MKERVDILLVEQELAPSREKAQMLIMAGEVFVGTERVDKPGQKFPEDTQFTIKGRSLKYVSRGGFKLEKIIEDYGVDLQGKTCVDIGASTGGFTDCMLQNGAEKVYAIDVGYNQLDYKLRTNPQVIVMERTNIRTFNPNLIDEEIDFISIDVSFISLELVLPVANKILGEGGQISALIKPQFEAGKEKVEKGGIIKNPKTHREVLEKMVDLVQREGLYFQVLTHSPIKGTQGNMEFLMLLSRQDEGYNIDIPSLLTDAKKELDHVTPPSN